MDFYRAGCASVLTNHSVGRFCRDSEIAPTVGVLGFTQNSEFTGEMKLQ